MATAKSQRIGIWIIALVLLAGTLGSFLVLVLAPKNQATEQARIEKLESEYQIVYDEYQAKVDAINNKIDTELSHQYFEEFHQQTSRIAAFDAGSVTGLTTEDLKIGDGDVAAEVVGDVVVRHKVGVEVAAGKAQHLQRVGGGVTGAAAQDVAIAAVRTQGRAARTPGKAAHGNRCHGCLVGRVQVVAEGVPPQ